MRITTRIVFGMALVGMLSGTHRLVAQDAAGEGWTNLLDKDFTGWAFHLTKEGNDNDGTYAIKDGVMTCTGKPSGYVYSEKVYSKFTLQLELMFERPEKLEDDAKFRGNSGVLIHVADKNALNVWPRSVEIQGMHRQTGLILPIPRSLKCGRTYDKEAFAKAIKPVGQWNAIEIEVNGGDMTIKLNGTVVSTVSDCELTEGPIAFQSEGAPTRWRNIRIKEK